jgi:hypothetical protein
MTLPAVECRFLYGEFSGVVLISAINSPLVGRSIAFGLAAMIDCVDKHFKVGWNGAGCKIGSFVDFAKGQLYDFCYFAKGGRGSHIV